MLPVIGVLVAITVYLIFFYNSLRTIQVQIKASIQEIGNQLKRQADLIPNLVDSAKGYLKHEKDIIKMLTDARKSVDEAVASNNTKKIDKAQDILSKALGSLKIILESNPQIRGADIIQGLMNELRDTADKVMYSRRTLIDLSADFNVKVTTIPGVWIASLFGFSAEKGLETPASGDFLKVSSTDTTNPKVNL